jgi:hypothetical protein
VQDVSTILDQPRATIPSRSSLRWPAKKEIEKFTPAFREFSFKINGATIQPSATATARFKKILLNQRNHDTTLFCLITWHLVHIDSDRRHDSLFLAFPLFRMMGAMASP